MNRDFTDRPLLAAAITGVRSFEAHPSGDLCGVSYPVPWSQGENFAVCLNLTFGGRPGAMVTAFARSDDHTVAQVDCSCGFYAYFDTGFNPFELPGRVLGLVEGYGRVTVGSRGFRAEKARIVALVEGRVPPRHRRWPLTAATVEKLTAVVCVLFGVAEAWSAAVGVVSGSRWMPALYAVFSLLYLIYACRLWRRSTRRVRRSRSPVSRAVRERYPDVPVYRTLDEALAEHPVAPPADAGVPR